MGSKSRVITFGCSFTFGLGLDDPTSQAWPAVLGKLTNRAVVNNGDPGSSNLEILSRILSFKFKKDDLVVVGWTYSHRDVIFSLIKNKKIGPWLPDALFGKWSEVHTDYDNNIRSGMYIHHAELYMNSLNLDYYNFWAPPLPAKLYDRMLDTVLSTYTGSYPKLIKKTTLHKNILNTEDLGSDNSHPGPVAHSIAATKLYEIINAK